MISVQHMVRRFGSVRARRKISVFLGGPGIPGLLAVFLSAPICPYYTREGHAV